MMNKEKLPHTITAVSFVVFIVLGLACASTDTLENDSYYREDTKILEGTTWNLTVSDWSSDREPKRFSFLSNGRLNGFTGSITGSTNRWKRTETDIELVVDSVRSIIKCKYNPENNTFSGTIYRTDGTSANVRMTLVDGANGNTLQTAFAEEKAAKGKQDYNTDQTYSQILAQQVQEDDFEIKQNADNTLTITGYKGTVKNVVIPDTLYGLKLTVIGEDAFREKGLTSVVIPNTVITLEDSAFSYNLGLTKVTLGNGLKTIGNGAFCGTGLTEVIIPDSVTIIGESAFIWSKLVKVTLGTGLQSIGKYAFQDNQIAELNLPPSLKEIKNRTFADNKIEKITFSTGLEIISEFAFYNNKITELQLPSSLKEIKGYAFAENKIQKITFSTGLETIGRYAFRNNQITELTTLPSSLKVINGGAFQKNQMQLVIIPNGVTSINNIVEDGYREGAFADNPLTKVVIPLSLAKGGIDIRQNSHTPNTSLPFGTISGSTITSITIPIGMDERTLKGIFEEAFVNFWINQNRAGGTYLKRGPIWTKE